MSEHFERERGGQDFSKSLRDYKNRCCTFPVILCNDGNVDKVATYPNPDCELVHADNPPVYGADNFIATWKQSLAKMPKCHENIQDIVVEMDARVKWWSSGFGFTRESVESSNGRRTVST